MSTPSNVARILPLSPAQAAILAAVRDPGGRAYVQQLTFSLTGPLDAARFGEAVRVVTARHGCLRTAFVHEGVKTPVQVELRERDLPLRMVAVAGRPLAEVLASESASEFAAFDLAHDPLARLLVVSASATEHRLVFTFHHVILDGWSLVNLMREIFAAYAALVRGLTPQFAPAFDYADYLSHLDTLDEDAALAAWVDYLAGMPEPESFPATQAFEDRGTGIGLHRTLLPAETRTAVSASARALRTTQSSIVTGAFGAFMARLAAAPEAVFGLANSGRPPQLPGIAGAVGLFVGTLPVRVRIDPAESFADFLRRTADEQRVPLLHQPVPLGALAERCGVRAPFRCLVGYENYPTLDVDEGGTLRVHDLTWEMETGYDFAITFNEDVDVEVTVRYDLARYGADEVERLLVRFFAYLDALVTDPGLSPGAVPIVPTDPQIGRPAAEPAWTTLADGLRAAVGAHPERPALTDGDRRWTYADLDADVERLAGVLAGRFGVGVGSLVGIWSRQDAIYVLLLLAVQRCGAAYLPLDEANPIARVREILAEAGANTLVVHGVGGAAGELGDAVGAANLAVTGAGGLDVLRATAPASRPVPAECAYVIYTSGSTGRPKGVVVTHRAVLNLCAWHTRAFGLTAEDATTKYAGVGFDASVWEIFPTLLAGAHLLVVPEALRLDLPGLDAWFARNGVTVSFLPTPVAEQFLDQPGASLRHLLTGGDRLHRFVPRGYALQNCYGPTENTVVSTWTRVTATGVNIPIGRPVDGTFAVVCDRWGNALPAGYAGELCLGGVGLAHGYLNRPELTADAFVECRCLPGERLYRSGDRAAVTADGEILFLGRLDRQVKVRGFRIELAEIDARIAASPGAGLAATVVRRDALGAPFLVAFHTGTVPGLRDRLVAELPPYMVPDRIVALDEMPLTPNGKVDRRALETLPIDDHHEVEEATDAGQALVLDAFREVLGSARVGVDDDFLRSGGDSIKAIQVSALLRKRGWQLSVEHVYAGRTPAACARLLTPLAAASDEAEPTGDQPLGPVQRWFLAEFGPLAHFNQAILLHAPGGLRPDVLSDALDVVSRRHPALRTRLAERDGAWVAVTDPHRAGATFRCGRSDLGANPAPGAAIEAECAALQRSLDPVAGPLCRAHVFTVGDGDHLFLAVHHLAVDAVSWRILLDDLAHAYAALAAGAAPDLGPRTRSYAAWAADVTAGTDHLARAEGDYWRGVCAAPATSLTDAGWVPDAEPGSRPAAPVAFTLDVETTAAWRRLPQERLGMQPHELLLAALAEALDARGDATAFRIQLEGHGRGGDDVARTVGWFTAVYPHLLDRAGAEPLARALAVKDGLRRVPGGGAGYVTLRHSDTADIGRFDLARPEVAVNYLGDFDGVEGELFRVSPFSAGPAMDPAAAERLPVDLNAYTLGGRLHVELGGAAAWAGARRGIGGRLERALRDLLAACEQVEGRLASPGDYGVGALDAAGLRALERRLGGPLAAVEPLTGQQRGLLLASLHGNVSGAYHVQVALTVAVEHTQRELATALAELGRRHDLLVSRFDHVLADEPLRAVPVGADVPLTYLDARHLAPEAALAAAGRVAAERAGVEFDLATEGPFRVHATRAAGETHLLFEFHHLVVDGWSVGVLMRELLSLLAGDTLPDAPGFASYVRYLAGLDAVAARAYWSEALAGFAEPTPITAAAPAELVRPASVRRSFGPKRSAALSNLAAERGLTLNALVCAGWAVLLGHLRSSDDVLFGRVVSGRPADLPEVDAVVGPCINTVPLRVRLAGEDPVPTVAARVQADILAALPHETEPLSGILAGHPLGAGLFDHIFVFENYPLDRSLAGEGAGAITRCEFTERTAYPLDVSVIPGDDLELLVRHDEAALDSAAAAALADRFILVLDQVIARPDAPLAEIGIVLPAERDALTAFNATATPYPPSTVVHEFAGQVLRRPDAVAVRFRDTELTFAELDRRANRLAHRLIALGVQPGGVVALLLRRSEHMPAAILGVLKTGCGYVPIGVADPVARQAEILHDSGASAVIAEPDAADHMATSLPVIDPRDPALADLASTAPGVEVAPDHPAYVIYTSGSTGRPKGVLIEHGSLMQRMRWTMTHYPPAPDAVVLQKSPYTFDVSVMEQLIWAVTGTGVAYLEPGAEGDPAAIVAAVERHRVTEIHFVPTMLNAFLQYLADTGTDLARLRSLRRVYCSGEALLPAHVALFRSLFDLPLVNMYGPTEATIECSWHECTAADAAPGAGAEAVSIGRPFGNVTLHILNRFGRELPPGLLGELAIGGPFCARGYVGRPELTAQRFPRTALGRVYLTGDLARWEPSGEMSIAGRMDHQVKLRGHRIETGEIESQLQGLAGVRQAAVVLRGAGAEQRLVAYVAAAHDDQDAWRAGLAERLPSYMVPSQFVRLDGIPRNANGKLDRAALPEPPTLTVTAELEPDATWTPQEQAVADAWDEVLGQRPATRTADFLATGGDSILAIQLVARLHRHGYAAEVGQVFDHPTVADLAAVLAPAASGVDGFIEGDDDEAPLSPIQSWFFETVGEAHHWNQTVLLDLDVAPTVAEVARAAAVVAAQHEALRTTFPERDGRRRAVVGAESALVVDEASACPSADEAAEVARLALEAQRGLDLAAGPIGALRLIHSASGTRLLVTLHHLVTDLLSLRYVVEDLGAALTGGEPAGATASPRRWARALAHPDIVAHHAHEAKHWLAQRPTTVPAPEDGSRTPRLAEVDATTTAALLGPANEAYGTEPQELLVAGLLTALAGVRGEPAVTVTFEGHGREGVPGLSVARTVGWFTSLFPVRFRLSSEPEAAVTEAKECLRRVPDHGIGHGVLRYAPDGPLPPEDGVPDVLFNFVGTGDLAAAGAGMRVSDFDPGPMTDPEAVPHARLVVNVFVTDGRLRISWLGGPDEEATVSAFLAALPAVAEHCLARPGRTLTPADFGDAGLALDDLDFITASLALDS